jgi:hypothetical protein
MADWTHCLVEGCNRRTTRCDAGAEWICATHWRMVPQSWKRRLSLFRRAYVKAERRCDVEGMDRAARTWWKTWGRVKAIFAAEPLPGEIPAGLAEVLRKDGLL